ncbi:hypothetical protein JCM8202_005372 [Rhodotorula sphaerocarpa]
MPLDLSHPRHLVPPPNPPRRAVSLKLTEDALRQLLDAATANGGKSAGAGASAIKVNLSGPHPVLVVGDVTHPLSVVPEASETALVRLSTASRDLVPIARIQHRATVQHRPADLDKAGQRARENREQAERAKEARKAVLLAEAPRLGAGSSKKRSTSNPRPRQVTSTAHSSPHPLSAPPSRLGSPASPRLTATTSSSSSSSTTTTARHPSRLTAVPPPPPPASRPPAGPSGTFRIGKGAVPSSLSISRSTSASSSSTSSSASSAVPLAAVTAKPLVEPAPVAAGPSVTPGHVNGSHLSPDLSRREAGPVRNGSSQGSAGTVTSPSATGEPYPAVTAATSPETLPVKMDVDPASAPRSATAAVPAGEGVSAEAEGPTAATEATGTSAATKSARPGGGGMMKGKETLKKEKRREERKRERPPAAPAERALSVSAQQESPAGKLAKMTTDGDEGEDEDAEGEVDEEVPAAVAEKDGQKRSLPPAVAPEPTPERSPGRKKRRIDTSEHEQASPNPNRPAPLEVVTAGSKPAPDGQRRPPKRSPSLASASATAKKDPDSAVQRSKKRKKEAVERWYSSSSEEDAEADADAALDAPVPAPPPSKALPDHVAPSASVEQPGATNGFPVPPAQIPAAVRDPSTPHATSRVTYLEAYAAYASLYARLTAERDHLERGKAGALLRQEGGPERIKGLIAELATKRSALEALHEKTRGRPGTK